MNKAMTTSLLPSPNFSFILLEVKKTTSKSLLSSHFFSSSIVVTIKKVATRTLLLLPIFFFFMLEMKMGNDKLDVITFFSSIVVVVNKQ
jgi:hypothetical protein